jgi:hypothetical protein
MQRYIVYFTWKLLYMFWLVPSTKIRSAYNCIYSICYLSHVTAICRYIVRTFQYISNKMQRYTVYSIWKLLHMFQVLPPPIIRSANNFIYSIWYLSHLSCYLPLAVGSSNGVTNTRRCRYSCLRSL